MVQLFRPNGFGRATLPFIVGEQDCLIKNQPQGDLGIIPQNLVGPYVGKRRYTKGQRLSDLVEEHYRKTLKGITFVDLMLTNIAQHKRQAQVILKYGLKSNILFTLGKHRPQEYFPVCLKSEITKKQFSKNIPIGVTGVFPSTKDFTIGADEVICNSLTGYILPLLRSAPFYIHNLRLTTKLTPQIYEEMLIESNSQNKSKKIEETIGKCHVNYLFYPNGTVVISTKNSNNPLRLDSELDRSRIFAFLGQVRDRLIHAVLDMHERLVPDITLWELTECDINKDIRVTDWLQVTGLKIQIRHLDHLFRIYIKSMRNNTVCRTEKCRSGPTKPAIQIIMKYSTLMNEPMN